MGKIDNAFKIIMLLKENRLMSTAHKFKNIDEED